MPTSSHPAGSAPTDPLDLTLTYSLKELLSGINDSLVGINSKLDQKASHEHVEAVEKRVAHLELSRAKVYGAVGLIGFLGSGAGYLIGVFSQSVPV